jgi:hypothetical protein
MVKSNFCRRNFLIYYISICLVCLGTFFYQPQIANAKMVNKSESSQKIDLKTFNPSQQEAQQLEELKASGEFWSEIPTNIMITVAVIGAIFFGVLFYQEVKPK